MIDPGHDFAEQLAAMRRRIGELERHAGRMPAYTRGAEVETTDGSGDVTVTHGLGATPTAVLVTMRASSAIPRTYDKTTTTFKIRFLNADTGAVLTSTSVGFDWAAFA